MNEVVERYAAESATGCRGAGDYRQWAREQGYDHCRVLDWTSSAGDWAFIVSDDGDEWFVMTQENNRPSPGFTRSIDKTRPYYGSADNVLQLIFEDYYTV